MKKELSKIKPRGIGVKQVFDKIPAVLGVLYFHVMTSAPMVAFAADKKKSGGTTDTGVADVTAGIDVIKDLVLGCVGGVGVIFLAWGLLDLGTAYAAHQTSEQSQAIKKVVGGLIMVAVPSILTLLGV